MKRIAVVTLAVATLVVMFTSTAYAAKPPSDRVVAIYFHRTKRCPTKDWSAEPDTAPWIIGSVDTPTAPTSCG